MKRLLSTVPYALGVGLVLSIATLGDAVTGTLGKLGEFEVPSLDAPCDCELLGKVHRALGTHDEVAHRD